MDKKIIWTHQAEVDLHTAFLDLLEYSESPEITSRIISEIYESVSVLAKNPEIYKLDFLKVNNKGDIRAFEKHTYRILYLIDAEIIYIIRVRSARKEPLEY